MNGGDVKGGRHSAELSGSFYQSWTYSYSMTWPAHIPECIPNGNQCLHAPKNITWIFSAALSWKQQECPSGGEWINEGQFFKQWAITPYKQIPTPGNHMKRISDMMIKRRHIRQTACYGVQQSKRIGADSLNRDYQAQGAIEGVRSQWDAGNILHIDWGGAYMG